LITAIKHPRMQAAIAELQRMISQEYPDARFRVYRGTDPPAVYVEATTTEDRTLEIAELISERELQMKLEDKLEIWVLPMFDRLRAGERATSDGFRPAGGNRP